MPRIFWVVALLLFSVPLSVASPTAAQRHTAGDAGVPATTPPPTAAQAPPTPAPDPLDQAARLIFESAREAFANGDYPVALTRFRQAYEASARPALLFNIATTLDRLRQDEEACATFERYLAADQDIPNRPEIEARVRSLHAVLAARSHPPTEQPAPSGPTTADVQADVAQPPSTRLRTGDGEVDDGGGTSPALFLTAGGLTVAAGALAVWAGLSTVSLNDDYEAYTASPGATKAQAKLLFDDASSRQLLANTFLVGAAVLGVASVVLALLTDWDGSAEAEPSTGARATTTAAVSFDAHGGLVGLTHRF